MSERIRCCIDNCRRSFKRAGEVDGDGEEVMCGRCWRTADRVLIERYKRTGRRSRRALRLISLKVVQRRPDFELRCRTLAGLFLRAIKRHWDAIKLDVQIKSALRLEGTAGELASRRSA